MAERRDHAGQRFGDYWLCRRLGSGSFGDVYLGEHVHEHSLAAVKVLQVRLTQSQELRAFINEIRTFRLQHPHIVRLLDVGIPEDDTPFLVMDYAPGGTLRDRHPKGSQLPLATVLTYVTPVASALQYAHDRRLIHRDVKPENMLLGPEGQVWLSDFGIATVAHSTYSLAPAGMGGTLPYMAPEQIQGQPHPQSDQYALGIVVYEWLTGARPFRGTPIEIAMQHQMTPAPALRAQVPTLVPEVEQVILTALSKDPRDRFGSIQSFASAFAQGVQAQLEQSFEKAVKPPSFLEDSRSEIVADAAQQPTSHVNLADTQTKSPLPSSLPEDVVLESSSSSAPVSSRLVAPPTLPLRSLQDSASHPSTKSFEIDGPSVVEEARMPTTGRMLSRRQMLIGLAVLTTASGEVIRWRSSQTASRTASHVSQSSPIASRTASHISQSSPTASQNAPVISRLYTYKGHTAAVFAVVWSPDGKRIASGSGDHTVQVWHAIDGSNVYTYKGHIATVFAVAWSPDGRYVASGSFDNTVRVWHAIDVSNIYTYRGHTDAVNAVAWSPDSGRIVSGSTDTTVQVWHAIDGANVSIYKGHTAKVFAVAWSFKSKHIASASDDDTVQVWQEGSS